MPPVERVAAPLSRRLFGGRLLWGLPALAALLSRGPAVAEAGTDGDWTLAGNSLPDATRFLGSTNAQPVTIKTGNVARVIITAIGRVGIGTTAPAAKLDVATSLNPAIRGNSTATGGVGVKGEASSTTGVGVRGDASATSGTNYGVFGKAVSPNGVGVRGEATSTGATGIGVYGYAARYIGVHGYSAGQEGNPTNSIGTYGRSDYGEGVQGWGPRNHGVHGISYSDNHAGVWGENPATYGIGVKGTSSSYDGVQGISNGANGYGVYAGNSAGGYTAYFAGKVRVTGVLEKAGGGFVIDHPLAPADRYLQHSFVESPDMKNVYDGVATLGTDGSAEVELPPYFQTLNRDFRYQLTCLGAFAPVYISKKIAGNRFGIAGGPAGLEVSWQVTGIRQDAWAEQQRLKVEWDKEDKDKGRYLHPREHGHPDAEGIGFERRNGHGGPLERTEPHLVETPPGPPEEVPQERGQGN